MIIALSDECPIFQPAHEMQLHRFFLTVAQRWHAVANPNPGRIQELVPTHIWSLYGESLAREYRLSANSPRSWVSHQSCASCDAERIARFYSLPTLMIVENASTDGSWLKLIVDRLRPAAKRLFVGDNPMLRVAQAGGIGEIPKELSRLSEPYLQARPCDSVPLRVIALADSDGTGPERPRSGNAAEVERTATGIGATSHILRMRSIENYTPDDALRAYGTLRRDRQVAAEQILKLDGDARNYYPMKDGLSTDRVSGIYPPDIGLGLGLGDFILDLIRNLNHEVTANGLRSRDGIGELDELLDKVERNL